ncbi:MAG: DegQ family serine endoprotease [Paracoccaceae bacterium]
MTHPIKSTARTAGKSVKALVLALSLGAAGLAGTTAIPAYAYAPPSGYADLVAKISPAVVFVEVTAKKDAPTMFQGGSPFPQGSPFDQFFKDFGQPGGPQQRERVVRGLGSGFIISSDGYIVTNNHVVDGAEKVSVKLDDGETHDARVIGTDPMTDVAVIKIDGVSGLPTVPFGDSSKLRVGDAVVAVGNPFGLGGTVTSGIVSALGRNINSGPYDSYIQTDAAINKGNSGGPLFNTQGEVVGMNTAIFSPSGGSVGIGFSIPSKTVQDVVAQLRDHGSVARGWLGVHIQSVTPELAQALGMDQPEGALVASVQPDSPAAKAGLKDGDVIVAVNGQTVNKMHELPSVIAAIPAGTDTQLTILRDGAKQDVSVSIGKLPEEQQMASTEAPAHTATDALGIQVQPMSPQLASQLGLPEGEAGVVVTDVAQDGPNADRLMPGDVIEQVDGKTVTTPAELAAAVNAKDGKPVLLRVMRQGNPIFVGAGVAQS